jgi:hypothetical protein
MWKIYAIQGAGIIGAIAVIIVALIINQDQWNECREQFSRNLCYRIMYINDK